MISSKCSNHGRRKRVRRNNRTRRAGTFQAIAVDGRIVVSRGLWADSPRQARIYRRSYHPPARQEANARGVCYCKGDLAADLLCPSGCHCDVHPQWHGLSASDLYAYCKWYVYNDDDHTSSNVIMLSEVMEQLELVELMLPEEQFFTGRGPSLIVRGGHHGRESLRVLPIGLDAGGSELAGRSRIRKYLLPGVISRLSTLLSAPLRIFPLNVKHTPTILTAACGEVLIRSCLGSVNEIDVEVSDAFGSYSVVRNCYLIRAGLEHLVSPAIAPKVEFLYRDVVRSIPRQGRSSRLLVVATVPGVCERMVVCRVSLAQTPSFARGSPSGVRIEAGFPPIARAWDWVDAPPDLRTTK